MAAVPYTTAEAFTHGKRAHNGEFRSEGDTILSYGLLLAHWETDAPRPALAIRIDHPLDGSDNRSVTTARHINALAYVLTRTLGVSRDALQRGTIHTLAP